MTNSATDYEFFWGGIYSQWYKAPIMIDGVRYTSNEQYMMAQKAQLFGDDVSYHKIMATNDCAKQKFIGRHVVGFTVEKWQTVCRLIVYRANLAKFAQNKDLWVYLDGTGHKWIVEASTEDKIWGIGMAENHPDILDPSKWQGTNWLGEAIMQVRSDIRAIIGSGFGMPSA